MMDVSGTESVGRQRQADQRIEQDAEKRSLPDPLPLYLSPPRGILPTAELEAAAAARVELLRNIKCADLSSGDDGVRRGADVKLDNVGHFMLRLAFSSIHALREWFVARECLLLERRWEHASLQSQRHALEAVGFKLAELPAGVDGRSPTGYYVMHFTDLPMQMLAGRQVLLSNGIAKVPEDLGLPLLLLRYRAHLRQSLDCAALAAPGLASRPVLGPALERLTVRGENAYTSYAKVGAGENEEGPRLSLENFEEELRLSFPPCMKHLVYHQRAGKHLKHNGRLQLRPFLREAGFAISESLSWWQREFLRDSAATSAKFRHEHEYHILHAYGLRGSGKKHFCSACPKISASAPSAVDVHGCPFAYPDAAVAAASLSDLPSLLHAWGAPPGDASTIANQVRAGAAPHAACAAFFQATHPGAAEALVRPCLHPVEYLRRSRRHWASEGHRSNGSNSAAVLTAAVMQVPRPLPPPGMPPDGGEGAEARMSTAAVRQPARRPLCVAAGLDELCAAMWDDI